MFTDPEKRLIIGFTKTRLVKSSFNEEEIIDVATG